MKKIVAVIGSSGAIGNALSNRLLEDDSVETIYKFSRSQKSEGNQKEKNFFIDIEDENSIKKSTENIPEDIKFDMIFVATGILHNDDDIFPEKSIKDINADKLGASVISDAINKSKLKLNLSVEDMVGNVNKFEASLYREIIK